MSLPYRTRASVQPHPVGCTVLRPLGHFQRQSPRENPSPETGALSAPFHPLVHIRAGLVLVHRFSSSSRYGASYHLLPRRRSALCISAHLFENAGPWARQLVLHQNNEVNQQASHFWGSLLSPRVTCHLCFSSLAFSVGASPRSRLGARLPKCYRCPQRYWCLSAFLRQLGPVRRNRGRRHRAFAQRQT